MAAFADVYADVAAMKAVTPTNDGQIALVQPLLPLATGSKGTLYAYRTAAAVGAANAGWYRVTNV